MLTTREILDDLLPLRPVIFAVLAALRGGAAHGHGILLRVNSELGERVLLGPGTLYRTLKEMRDQGLVEHALPPADEPAADGRRQYYRLTDLGTSAVEAEARRLAALLDRADLADLASETP